MSNSNGGIEIPILGFEPCGKPGQCFPFFEITAALHISPDGQTYICHLERRVNRKTGHHYFDDEIKTAFAKLGLYEALGSGRNVLAKALYEFREFYVGEKGEEAELCILEQILASVNMFRMQKVFADGLRMLAEAVIASDAGDHITARAMAKTVHKLADQIENANQFPQTSETDDATEG